MLDKPGTYYLLGIDPNAGTEAARCAPAVARVTVRDVGDTPQSGDVNWDGAVDILDYQALYMRLLSAQKN